MNVRQAIYAAIGIQFIRRLFRKLAPHPGILSKHRALPEAFDGDYVLCLGFSSTHMYYYPIDVTGIRPLSHSEIVDEIDHALESAGFSIYPEENDGSPIPIGATFVEKNRYNEKHITYDIPGIDRNYLERMERVVRSTNY